MMKLIGFDEIEIEGFPLTELLFDTNFSFPKFLFYFDCSYVSSLIKNNPNTNIRQCTLFLKFLKYLVIKLESISI